MFRSVIFLLCLIDDGVKEWVAAEKEYCEKHNIKLKKPTRSPHLSLPEILTIILNFYSSHLTNFKNYNPLFLAQHRAAFPNRPTYTRFDALMKKATPFLILLLKNLCEAEAASEGFMDSTPLRVCHNKRIFSHKVFKGMSARGTSTMGFSMDLNSISQQIHKENSWGSM